MRFNEAYEVRAVIEEIAGRTAATVLKGYTAGLRIARKYGRMTIVWDSLQFAILSENG